MAASSIVRALALACALALAASAGAQASNPDFDAVTWRPLGCGASPLTAAAPRGAVDLVGDATSAAAYVALDASYLYFRYRVNGDPSGPRGFARSSDWNMLVQVPSGSPFQYQYQLSLNGDGQGGDTVEIWANSTPQDITFAPLVLGDPAIRLFRQVYDFTGPTTVNTTPLARSLPTAGLLDATDYFVDVAFPIAVLAANGLAATDLPGSLFYPATANGPDRHNKDWLDCPFLPATTLTVDAAVAPPEVHPNVTTRVSYTVAVHDTGGVDASGTVLTAPALPSYLANIATTVSADAPGVTGTVVSMNPLQVRVPRLPAGATVTVRIDADATPSCTDASTTTPVAAIATNASGASASGRLDTSPGAEVCDGVDNNCDGRIDEGGDALCNDGIFCNGTETCGGAAGCRPGAPPCDDGDPCTTDGCDAQAGCTHTPIVPCTRCASVADCNDGDGCTTDGCSGGRCTHAPVIGCVRCATAADCADANPCTDDICGPERVCLNPQRAGCVPCTSRAQCDDGNPCTLDQCGIDGTCAAHIVLQGCRRCATPADCDDGRRCTEDLCGGGVCTHADIADCTECTPVPEICNDGIDNDCDGLVDCADPDCHAAPACAPQPTEICNNCIDDDGDGLVDSDDPDCCAEHMALGVGHLTVKPPAGRARGNRFRLEAQYADATPAFFNPLRQDTSVQLSDATGPVFCATVPAQHWRRLRRLTFRFSDRASAFAGGLEAGEFRISRTGALLFRASGRNLGLRPIDGTTVRLTVRVRNACSQSSTALRTGRRGLVFP